MTHHPFAQIARNGNPKSQENRPGSSHFLRNRLLHSPPFASHLNVRAILHGRRFSLAQLVLSLFSLFFHEINSGRGAVRRRILELKGSVDEITASTLRCFSLFSPLPGE